MVNVRIRHESKESGDARVRHESKEKGVGYIAVNEKDKVNLSHPLSLDIQQCELSCYGNIQGDITPPSQASVCCSCGQKTPGSGSLINDEKSGSLKSTNSSQSTKISDNCTCVKADDSITSASQQGAYCDKGQNGGAVCNCEVVDKSSQQEERITKCQYCANGELVNQNGFHYEFPHLGQGESLGKQNERSFAPLSVSKLGNYVQCHEYECDPKDVEILTCEINVEDQQRQSSKRSCCYHGFVLAILLAANLLNYMDRYTIAGVLPDIKVYYSNGSETVINDSHVGLLQTSFIVFYMVFSPLFGYLGDRYNRTILMSIGILAWSVVTLAGSFIPADHFWVFVFMRGLVGIGEASYSTIAPTIIADLFTKDNRSKALAMFYFAIPVGSGLGYIVGSSIAKVAGQWQWSLRFTPALGLVCALLIFFVLKEPPRGESDGGGHLHTTASLSAYRDDLVYLFKNKSFMLSTGGFTCVAFLAGALAFWAPTFFEYAIEAMNHNANTETVALKFGIVTCLAGLLGVIIGSESARRLRHRFNRADPLVCAVGLLGSTPFLFLTVFLIQYNMTVTWIMTFIGMTLLCLNWSIVTDILLYVVIPTRRSTAEAFQILISHALGDAGSPYLVGLVSDMIKGEDQTIVRNFVSLQYALYIMSFVAVIGGAFFLATASFLVKDKARADKIIAGISVVEVDDTKLADQSSCDSISPIYSGKPAAIVEAKAVC